jgi:hypothetical protein
MQEKVQLVTIKAIKAEDTNIDVKFFNKLWKSWTTYTADNKLIGIIPAHDEDNSFQATDIRIATLESMIKDGEWRLLNCYNEDPDTRYFTRDKNEVDRQKKLLAALKEIQALGADVKVQF